MRTRKILSTVACATLLTATISTNLIAQTNTGLDQLTEIIKTDEVLAKNVTEENIFEAYVSADQMNQIIIEAVIENGLANDGVISTADTREINDYIFANYHDEWVLLHGDDENGEETGFHLVQNNGAKTKIFGRNAINRVADGIYHLGFESSKKNRLLNEDGNNNVSFKAVGTWLTALLENDMTSLSNESIIEVTGTTGTGLDKIIEIVYEDVGLATRISTGDIREGSKAVDGLNKIIIEATVQTGIANDGQITASDVRELSDFIVANNQNEWIELHGDDEENEETGYHLIQNDGAKTKIFGRNAINTVADGIYHLGFGTDGVRILNEDGNKNAKLVHLATWLQHFLIDDLEALQNAEITENRGTTNTGLDKIVEIIYTDRGLQQKVSTSDLRTAGESADIMNQIIIEAIVVNGLANDGQISIADTREINDYIFAKYQNEWIKLHGDDEDNGEETGFHLVQNDGAKTKLFKRNAINRVADGIYHLGFESSKKNRLLNEDGNNNSSFKAVSGWLNGLLNADLGILVNPEIQEVTGNTGTGLDKIIDIIYNDERLGKRISTGDIREGAEASNELNKIIIASIEYLGILNDNVITSNEVVDLSEYIRNNYLEQWLEFHGDDEENEETGYHLVQNDGAKTKIFGRNAVNQVFDGIYHLGFGTNENGGRLLNEDGNENARVRQVAQWLNQLLTTN